MKATVLCAALVLVSAGASAAEPCINNFKAEGNFLTGKTYKTSAVVSRVQGWKAPANNALQFEVVYKADDSGEISKLSHEAVRQPDGVWLFTQ